jgi:acetate kinase
MKILVLNCGSSSIKYKLFNMASKVVLAQGVVEKVGMQGAFLRHEKNNGEKIRFEGEVIDHQTGIEYVLGVLTSDKHGCLKSLDDIEAVGHRVVHGGEEFNMSMLTTPEVKQAIERVIDLAPLHNPPNLKGIEAIELLLSNVPQVAVFDTAFHQTMPDYAYMYAIPYSLYKKHAIRRYGFHGTSHRYISKRACEVLGVDINTQKMITCHLGNGASIAAIHNGRCVDTSMGLTPLEGLIMGTRSGDMDLGVLTYIMEKEKIGIHAANTLLNKHSGMLGITGVSSDMREIETSAGSKDNKRSQLALRMYAYRIRKYIGAYAAALKGVDIIVFAGGIGENGPEIREDICKDFEFLGIDFDNKKNDGVRGQEVTITKDSSKVKVIVVPTNEELVIANDTLAIVSEMKSE